MIRRDKIKALKHYSSGVGGNVVIKRGGLYYPLMRIGAEYYGASPIDGSAILVPSLQDSGSYVRGYKSQMTAINKLLKAAASSVKVDNALNDYYKRYKNYLMKEAAEKKLFKKYRAGRNIRLTLTSLSRDPDSKLIRATAKELGELIVLTVRDEPRLSDAELKERIGKTFTFKVTSFDTAGLGNKYYLHVKSPMTMRTKKAPTKKAAAKKAPGYYKDKVLKAFLTVHDDNYASLADVKAKSGLAKPKFHLVVNELRDAGIMSLDDIDGRHRKPTKRELAAAIVEGNRYLSMAALRDFDSVKRRLSK